MIVEFNNRIDFIVTLLALIAVSLSLLSLYDLTKWLQKLTARILKLERGSTIQKDKIETLEAMLQEEKIARHAEYKEIRGLLAKVEDKVRNLDEKTLKEQNVNVINSELFTAVSNEAHFVDEEVKQRKQKDSRN